MKKLLAGILSTAILAGMLCGVSASAEPDVVTGKADELRYACSRGELGTFTPDELHNGFTITSKGMDGTNVGDQQFVVAKEPIDLRTPLIIKYKLADATTADDWPSFAFYMAASPSQPKEYTTNDFTSYLSRGNGTHVDNGGTGHNGFQIRLVPGPGGTDNPVKAPKGTVCVDGVINGNGDYGATGPANRILHASENAMSGFTADFNGDDEQTLKIQLVEYKSGEQTLYKLQVVLNPDVARAGGAAPTVLEAKLGDLHVNDDRYMFYFGAAASNGLASKNGDTSLTVTHMSRVSGATDVEDNKPATTAPTTPPTAAPTTGAPTTTETTTAPTEAPKATYKDLFYFVGDQNKMKIEDASNGVGFKLTASKLGNTESLFALSKNAVDLSKEFVITYTIPSVVVSEDMSSIQNHWAAFMFYLQNEATDSTAIIDPATITKTMWEEQGKHYGFQLRIATSGPDAGCLLIDGANGQTLVLAQANTLVENPEDLILHGSQNIDCGYDGKFTAASVQTMKVALKPVVEGDGRTIMHLQVTMNPDQPRKEGKARTIDVSLEKLGVPGDRTKFYFGLMPNNGDPNYPELTTSIQLLTANQDILPEPENDDKEDDDSKPTTGEVAWPLCATVACVVLATVTLLVSRKKAHRQV